MFVAKEGEAEFHRRANSLRKEFSADVEHYAAIIKLRKEVQRDPSLIPAPSVTIRHVLEDIRKLEPRLIEHLQNNSKDLSILNPDVFEHLIAEFFVQRQMFDRVALVGRDNSTSADLFAATKVAANEMDLRVFVEVKRWRDKIGVQVIDNVLGAMFGERGTHGWNAAMIVTLSELSDIRKYSVEQVQRLGITVKDQSDLLRWLKDYVPKEGGLWLPNPVHSMP